MSENANGLPVVSEQPASVVHVDSTAAQAAGQERDAAADLAMCEAARPGPWEARNDNEGTGYPPFWVIGKDVDEDNEEAMELYVGDYPTAEFIAESRTMTPHWINRCVAAEGKPTFERIIHEASEDTTTEYSLYQPRGGRTKAQAQEIAAALVANVPGAQSEERYGETYKTRWLRVSSGERFHGERIAHIFFTEEATPHV